MSLHDLFTQTGRDRARRLRLRLARRRLGLPGLRRRGPGAPVRLTARGRRQLAAIDRALAAELPRLASMFAMFNQLAAQEEPASSERLPSRRWPRPRLGHVALFAALAAIAALCVALSTQVHTVLRPCPTWPPATSTASPSASPSASPFSVQAIGPAVLAPVRGLNCQAYATTNK
jgi:hypothetical protein